MKLLPMLQSFGEVVCRLKFMFVLELSMALMRLYLPLIVLWLVRIAPFNLDRRKISPWAVPNIRRLETEGRDCT